MSAALDIIWTSRFKCIKLGLEHEYRPGTEILTYSYSDIDARVSKGSVFHAGRQPRGGFARKEGSTELGQSLSKGGEIYSVGALLELQE